MMPFTVILPVYKNDKPEDLYVAVESISEKQTVKPDEILIVIDGPIPERLVIVINELCNRISNIRVLRQPVNKGLGFTLQKGIENATYEIVARMDSDDISYPERFEKQLKVFETNPTLSLVGGTITEFIDSPQNIVGRRIVPQLHDEICSYMKSRCPFNHVTVMYKRSDVLKAGNYQDWFWNEDYYLWIRMMMAGCKFANISDPLVNVRVGKDMYARRGGINYFKSEAGIQRYMYRHRLISLSRYAVNVAIRFIVQVLMPNNIRGFVFQKLFRSR